jgi:hypothetical protein
VLQVNVGKNWHDLGYSGARTCAQRLRQLAVDYELPFRLVNTNPRPSTNTSTAHICPPISAERTTMAPASPKKGSQENQPLVAAPAAASREQTGPVVTKKLSSKKARAKAKKAARSNDSESSDTTPANTSAVATANLSTTRDSEEDEEPKEKVPEKPKITRYQKKRRREFKVIKNNRPHFSDEQAWIVVDMVDASASLQDQNEADKQVLTSETDSDWDDDKMRKARGLRRQ